MRIVNRGPTPLRREAKPNQCVGLAPRASYLHLQVHPRLKHVQTVGGNVFPSPGNGVACILCRKGKFSTAVGASSSLTCEDCPAGTYGPTEGGEDISTCLFCDVEVFHARFRRMLRLSGRHVLDAHRCKRFNAVLTMSSRCNVRNWQPHNR